MRNFSFLLSLVLLLAVLPATPWVQWPRADREAVYKAWQDLPETKRPPFSAFRQSWAEERHAKQGAKTKNKNLPADKKAEKPIDKKIDKIFEKNVAPR